MAAQAVLEMFKHVSSFHIPNLNFTLVPPRMNPLYDADVIDKWCIEFLGLKPDNEKAKRQLVQCKLGLVSAVSYPYLSAERLAVIAKFIAWFFLADDVLDNPEICPSDMKNMTVAYIEILKGNYEEAKSLIQSKEILRQMDMFHDLWLELSSHMPQFAKERFVDAMEESLEMVKVESSWLHHNLFPNVETYLWMRGPTSGVAPCFVAIDGLQSLELTEEVLEDPLIKKLEVVGITHIALSNDIVSFRKEWVCGKYLNIVPILACHHKCTLDEAIIKAVEMVNDLEEEYIEVIKAINSNTLLLSKQGAKEYVDGIGIWMKGNSEWGWMTGRYHEDACTDKFGTFKLA